MEQGILLEVNGRTAIVLTPGGEFKRIPAPAVTHQIGDEVSYAPPRSLPWLTTWGVAAAAAVIMAVAGGGFGYQAWSLNQPVALVSIDINPSIELILNRKDQVLHADAMNADGQAILDVIKWDRQPLDVVVADVTAHAVTAGKLNPDDAASAVLLAVAPAKGNTLAAGLSDRIRAEAKQAVVQSLGERTQVRNEPAKTAVAAVEATGKEREEAARQGLTPGKFLLYQELQAKAPDLKPEQLLKVGPGALFKQLGISPDEVFNKAEHDHGGQVPGKADHSKTSASKGEQGKGNQGSPNSGKASDGKGNNGKDNSGKATNGNDSPGQSSKSGTPPGQGQQGDKNLDNSGDQKPTGAGQQNGSDKQNGDKQNGDKQSSDKQSTDKQSSDKQNGDKQNGSDQQNGSDKQTSSEGKGNKSSQTDDAWHLPFGVTVPKPPFMRNGSQSQGSTESRAAQPGTESHGQGNQNQGGSEQKTDQKGRSQKQGH